MKRIQDFLAGKGISPPAKALLRYALALSALLLAASLLITVYAGDLNAHSARLLRLAADIYRAPLGVIFLSGLGALYIDDVVKR